jgi:hypothetical protein
MILTGKLSTEKADLAVQKIEAKKSTHPCALRESAISEKVKIDTLI